MVPAIAAVGVFGLFYGLASTWLGWGRVPVQAMFAIAWALLALAVAAMRFNALRVRAADGDGPGAIRFYAPLGRKLWRDDEPAVRRASDLCACLVRHLSASLPGTSFSEVVREDFGAGFDASRPGVAVYVALSVVSDSMDEPSSEFSLSVTAEDAPFLCRDEELARLYDLRRDVEAEIFDALSKMGFDPVFTRRGPTAA